MHTLGIHQHRFRFYPFLPLNAAAAAAAVLFFPWAHELSLCSPNTMQTLQHATIQQQHTHSEHIRFEIQVAQQLPILCHPSFLPSFMGHGRSPHLSRRGVHEVSKKSHHITSHHNFKLIAHPHDYSK